MSTRHSCACRPWAMAIVLLLSPLASGAQEAPDLPDSPALSDFIRVAQERSPSLEAGRRHWRADAEAAGAAGSFPDPMVSYTWYPQEVETRVGPQKDRLSVRQRLPWFGKLGLSRDAAQAGAGATRARYDDRRLQLRRDVTLAWLDLYWLGRATSLTRDNLDLLIDLERIVRERYRNARVAHADLIRVQVELGTVENRLRSHEDRLRPAVARMNTLLHRPGNAHVPVPTEVPDWGNAPEAEGVLAGLRDRSHRLHEGERRVAQADAARRLANRARWPDWTLGADWIRTDDALNPAMTDSGKDAFMVSVSVNVPIFRGKWDAPARAAEERYAASRADLQFTEDELVFRAEELLFDWRDADRRLDLYRGALLPKARESYLALDTAYRTGQGGFLDLIEAQRMLLSFELERESALTDRGRSAARLAHLASDERGEDSR